jgi:hypothetical protein
MKMIVDFLLTLFMGVIETVLGLIPEWEMFSGPRGVDGSVFHQGWADRIGEWLGLWDLFFPVAQMFICLLLIIGARLLVGVVQVLVFVYDKFPFKSS